jgi:adenosylcobinamide-phosphate synthase
VGAGRALGLLLGVAADAVFGDPRRFHPVAAFGSSAAALEKRLYADSQAAGAAYTAVLVGGTVAAGVAVERLARRNWLTQALATGVATWVVLGGNSLATEGTSMGRELADGDLEAARSRLPSLCGRDAHRLDTTGLARATVESVAENTSDAVVAPLFWGAVYGVPGLLGYRAANTLDAMVGHKSPRYLKFGWASARLDDLLNLLPSRLAALLTVGGAPVVGGSASQALETWRRDASAHPSTRTASKSARCSATAATRTQVT